MTFSIQTSTNITFTQTEFFLNKTLYLFITPLQRQRNKRKKNLIPIEGTVFHILPCFKVIFKNKKSINNSIRLS